MTETERVINDLNVAKITLCNPQMLLTPEMRVRIGQVITSAIDLLKDQETVVLCKDCKFYDSETGICAKGITHGYADTWSCDDGERL